MLPPPAPMTPTSGGVAIWRSPACAPHLRRAFVEEAVAVQPSGRELSAVGVQRQRPVARDARAAVDERAALADAAQPERLEPRHREPREAVVELRHLHVGGREVRARPQLRARVAVRHRRQVVELVPRRAPVRSPRPPLRRATADGADPARDRCRDTITAVPPSHGASQSYRQNGVGDHARRHVVVHRHRVAVDRLRIDLGVAPRVQRDPRHLLARRAVLVQVRAARTVRSRPRPTARRTAESTP